MNTATTNDMWSTDSYSKPNPSSSALITVDFQNDFCLRDAPAEVPGTREVLPKVKELVDAYREEERPVVHLVRLYMTDGSNVDLCRRNSVEEGWNPVEPDTRGAELVDELKFEGWPETDHSKLLDGEYEQLCPNEWIVYKPRWSGFYRTGLDDFLTRQSIDTLVLCGCNFPNCPRTTVYDATSRNYRVVMARDATSGTYSRGLEELRDVGVSVADADEVVDWITSE
ncbi:MAG: cysteine hydrolase family protein [Halobacteria archaeon]